MTTLLNRTDLLACLNQYGEDEFDSFAALFGFELRKAVKATPRQGVIDVTLQTPTFSGTGHSVEKSSAQFHRIVAHLRFKDEEINLDEPEWFIKARPFEGNEATLKAPEGAVPQAQPALMPWPRLWSWLKLALGANGQSHKPDLPRLVDSVASGQILRHLPKIKRKTWAAQAQLILDFDASLLPFWPDFNCLHEHLADFRGQTGLEVLAFPDGDPVGRCWQDTPEGWRDIGQYRPLAADVPVLVLSDLGCYDTSGQRRLRWLRFGKQLARTAHRVVALLPCPPRCWDGELMQLFISVYWDRAVRPPRHSLSVVSLIRQRVKQGRIPAAQSVYSHCWLARCASNRHCCGRRGCYFLPGKWTLAPNTRLGTILTSMQPTWDFILTMKKLPAIEPACR